MRLIDADELSDEVMHLFIAITGNPKQTTVVNECKRSFIQMIDDQPTVGKWIPIEEGLPPIGKPLAVTIKDTLQGKPNERRYPVYYEKDSMKDGYHWSWRYGDFAYELIPDVSEVIAWQPLPEPYQPKEERQ